MTVVAHEKKKLQTLNHEKKNQKNLRTTDRTDSAP